MKDTSTVFVSPGAIEKDEGEPDTPTPARDPEAMYVARRSSTFVTRRLTV
jgi:hypothetical protein